MLIPYSLPHRIRDSPVLEIILRHEAYWEIPSRANNHRIRVSVGVIIILIAKGFVKINNMQLLPKRCRRYKNRIFLKKSDCIEMVNCG